MGLLLLQRGSVFPAGTAQPQNKCSYFTVKCFGQKGLETSLVERTVSTPRYTSTANTQTALLLLSVFINKMKCVGTCQLYIH